MEDALLLVWGDAPMEREEGEDEDEEKRVLGWGRRRRKTARIAMAAEYALLREVVVANTTRIAGAARLAPCAYSGGSVERR